MEHELKILETYASMHFRGVKPWELRVNDRDYKEGDCITFIVISKGKEPTGVRYRRKIINVFKGGAYGLDENYCIITLSSINL